LIQAVATCAGVTSADRSLFSIWVQHGQPGLLQSSAVTPPCAPSTTTKRGSRDPSASAIGLKALNSCVVFDIPIDRKT